MINSVPNVRPRMRRLVPWLYVGTAAFILLDWLTPLVHGDVVRTSWGWAYVLGAGFPLSCGWIFALASTAIWLGVNDSRTSPSAAERGQTSMLVVGLVVPMVVASVTDGVLSLLGIHFPYLGSMSVAYVGILGALSAWRYGYSLLVPTAFTVELSGAERIDGERREEVGALVVEARELLDETLEGVDRAVSIVRDIRGFSHSGSGERETVDLVDLLDSVLRVAAPQLGVPVRVVDDGAGIPVAVRDRVFDPFFTTKPVGEGTGIGLAISYEIVRKHGGQIELGCPETGEPVPRCGCPSVRRRRHSTERA